MFNRQYAMGAETQSRDLANTILSSSTPSQILSACKSISTHLRSCPSDQSRHFFSVAFPAFISKLFGYGGPPASIASPMMLNTVGWINVVNQANDLNLISDVFALLSPSGILFQTIFSADRHSLVKYVFPSERLPEWIRYMLYNDKYCHALPHMCPLLDKRLKANSDNNSRSYQVQLSIFEYFVFWFAYYPICKGSSSPTVSEKRSKRFRLENWAISRLSNSKGEKSKGSSNLYLHLLYAYLKEFVPLDEPHAHLQGYRSSLLQYDNDQSGGLIQERAAFFVNALVNYWLVDNDPCPIPSNIAKYHGILTPFRADTPPSSNIGDFVKILVEYVILCSNGTTYPRHDLMPTSINNGTLDSPWNPSFQRGVYRYILRTLLYCPIGGSLKNVSEVFSVWVSLLEPWKIEKKHLFEQDNNIPDFHSNNSVYSRSWETCALSNYLFYTSLLTHFLEFSHKFLLSDTSTILRMVTTIVDVLYDNKELTNLLKEVNLYLSSKAPGSFKSNVHKHFPLIREQLLDWEDGFSKTDTNPNLFTDGGNNLLQLFVQRAEAAIQPIPADNLPHLDSLKTKITEIFGPHSPETERNTKQEQPKGEIFTPRKFRAGNTNPMQQPFSNNEVQWLAKVLVRFSCRVNDLLGLNHIGVIDGIQKPSFFEVTRNCVDVYGVKGVLKMIFDELVDWLRVHGFRVNLRMLASKWLVFLLVMLIFFRTIFLISV